MSFTIVVKPIIAAIAATSAATSANDRDRLHSRRVDRAGAKEELLE